MAKILIVDDYPEIIEMLKIVVEELGHQVTTAINGKVALLLLQKEKFDILITDCEMPLMNGLTLISKAKRERILPKKIVVMTSSINLQEELLEIARSQPEIRILAKPFSYKELEKYF